MEVARFVRVGLRGNYLGMTKLKHLALKVGRCTAGKLQRILASRDLSEHEVEHDQFRALFAARFALRCTIVGVRQKSKAFYHR
jgi:hypothetical protein